MNRNGSEALKTQKSAGARACRGGLTGAVYEIGALRAIDDLLIDRTGNDFDIYVGASAGAIVAAFLANGLAPDEMYQGMDRSHPTRRLVIDELAEIRSSGFDLAVVRRILEARTLACTRRRRNTPFCQLQQTLVRLELELDEVEPGLSTSCAPPAVPVT
jgi:hypothetical protein